MNTENDYLWDKNGEPDPEIQQLEEILGTLRYQPRPFEIPAEVHPNLQVVRERNFFRSYAAGLAIAATIALVLLGLGFWFGLQRLQQARPSEIVKTPSKPAVSSGPEPSVAPSPNQDQKANLASDNGQDQKHTDAPRRHRVYASQLAGNTNRPHDAARKNLIKDSEVAANELQEGTAARDQLLLGLRVACTKINFAQKKAQESTSPRDLIHNQHKIG
jgi:hypothetical protein